MGKTEFTGFFVFTNATYDGDTEVTHRLASFPIRDPFSAGTSLLGTSSGYPGKTDPLLNTREVIDAFGQFSEMSTGGARGGGWSSLPTQRVQVPHEGCFWE